MALKSAWKAVQSGESKRLEVERWREKIQENSSVPFFGIPENHIVGYAMAFGEPAVEYHRTVQRGCCTVMLE